MTQPTIIFAHIPKAAGTTLHRIIEQQYHRQEIYSIYSTPLTPEASFEHFTNLTPEQRAQIRILKGHMSFGLHAYIPGPVTYFTLLREPIERVVSFYYYIRQSHQHYLHDHVLAHNLSLQQYIESQLPFQTTISRYACCLGRKGLPMVSVPGLCWTLRGAT